MYLSFYHLLDKPFTVRPDPSFLWLGPNYAEALSVLRHGIFANKGFVLLTGDAGSGKTTLVNALTGSFDKNVVWAVVGNPGLDRLDFYNAIARGFAIDREFSSKVQFLLQFSAFLHSAREVDKKVVLLVDDCHQLSQDLLEELRLLANIEMDGTRLIDICFVGRPEFLDTLTQPNNRAVGQRLTRKAELVPLSPSETEEYIRHRLKVAGTEEELFTAKALRLIYRSAEGNPRLINMICDQALNGGAAAENRLIGRKIVEECLAQLNLPHASRQEKAARAGDKKRVRHLLHRFTDRLTVDRRWRWAKYGLGVMLIGGIGVSYFLQPEDGRDPAADAGRPAVRQPAAKEKVRDVLSPVVGKLEPIGKAIDLNMVADRKETMVKKEDGAKKAMDERAVSAVAKEEAPTEPEQVPVETADTPVGLMPEPATPEKPGEEKAGEEKSAGISAKPPAEQAKADPVKEPARLPPMQPGRIVLPLRPNSLELTDEAAKEYGEFVAELKKYPKAKLLVKGFVSAKTNSPENVKLSDERARAVQKLLVKSGIDASRITVKGMGNQEPIAGNDTSEGRTKNRRVEVEVVSDGR
ncbi:MAG: hypothetical protein A2X81_09545 [Desulfobacterales bacterium GWB2_56_26]|nr:MAG: hypothetical protein A2X81_09545 [Desulfobacterales bacterium GWB2_56_26]